MKNPRAGSKLHVLVLSLLAGTALAATPAMAGKVSGLSPFANCTADNLASQVGTNYPDSEIEPFIDVNKTNTFNLIAAWQQDRWSNGGSRGLAAGVSLDGGQSWATVVPQKVSKCSGGEYDRASDPWITISPNGRAYFMSLAFNNDRPDGGGGKNAMLVHTSDNGGFAWSDPIPLIIDTDGQIFNDKNAMTADPTNSNYVYGVWDRLQDFTLPSGKMKGPARAGRTGRKVDGAATARDHMRALKAKAAGRAAAADPLIFKGPTYFVRTTNGGTSWEPPKKIYDPGKNAQTINNLVVVPPDGSVINFFTNITALGETSIGMIKSLNKGLTFKRATLPVSTNVTLTGTLTPDAQESVRDGNILFDVAVDHGNGNLYLVWQDGRFNGLDVVAFSM
jgi:hypothetical protein